MSIERNVRRVWRCCALGLLLGILAFSGGCRMLRARKANAPPFRKITPAVAYIVMADSPDVTILDLRPSQQYHGDTGHLHNARSYPLAGLPGALPSLSDLSDDTMLVYCDDSDCGDEGMAVLVTSGFDNAILIEGGIDRWIRDGFKTDLAKSRAGQRSAISPISPIPATAGSNPIPPAEPGEPGLPAEPAPPPPAEEEPSRRRPHPPGWLPL